MKTLTPQRGELQFFNLDRFSIPRFARKLKVSNKTMSRRSRYLLIAMSTAFGIAALGLVIGMCYDLYLVSIRHAPLENVMGTSIAYNKTLGGFGVLGMVLLFAFLFSAIADKKQDKPR
jgi:hypothetical protein